MLIADDFTNSGSTLFGSAKIVREWSAEGVRVEAYVTHLVAKYDPGTVKKLVSSLYEEGSLDYFHCSDSIPRVVGWLEDEVKKRADQPPRCRVWPLAPLISKWLFQLFSAESSTRTKACIHTYTYMHARTHARAGLYTCRCSGRACTCTK